jgi:hypothetical protein
MVEAKSQNPNLVSSKRVQSFFMAGLFAQKITVAKGQRDTASSFRVLAVSDNGDGTTKTETFA